MRWRVHLAAALLTLPAAAQAVDPRLEWRTLTTPHFELHYAAEQETMARRAAVIAEAVHVRLSQELRWQPAERTQLVLSDELDLANGFATPLPFNQIGLYAVAPDDVHGLGNFDDWLEQLIVHEYTHTLHLDRAEGIPHRLRSVFGRHLLLFPNLFQPTWLIEGLATYNETDATRQLGRGDSSLYRMYMRAEVASRIKPFDQVSMSGVTTWPAGRLPYLYGVHFYQFLEQRYGKAAIQTLIDDHSRHALPFMVNTSFYRATGKTSGQLWAEFADHLRRRYQPELAAIRADGVVAGERISAHGHGTSSVSALPDGRVFYVRSQPDKPTALMLWRPGQGSRELARLHSGARIAAHPRAGVLVAQPEVCDNYNLYYDLYCVDPDNGDLRRLTRCGRYHYAAFTADGERIVAVRMAADRAWLDVLSRDGKQLDTLWQGEPGEVVSGLAVSPAGNALAVSLWRPGRGWNLELFELAGRRWRALTADPEIETEPAFSADGGALLFSSDHGGVFNLRRLDLNTGALTTLTNVEGGAFMPSQGGEGGEIYYIGYTSAGYDLFRLREPAARPMPASRQRLEPVPAVTAAEELPSKPYSPWSSLRPRSWSPVLSISEDATLVGASVEGQDALGVHGYALSLAYEFRYDMWTGGASYRYDFWQLSALRAPTYDYRDDDLLRVRRLDTVELSRAIPWLGLKRSYALHFGAGLNRESDHHRADGVEPLPTLEERYLGAAFSYDDTESLPRSVSRSHGRRVRVVAETLDPLGGDYEGEVYTFDWREYLPLWGQHVLALRLAQGWGTDTPRPFELGGQWVSTEPVEDALLFGRRGYGLRGYPSGLDELTGRRMRLASLEYRFPIMRLERGFTRAAIGMHQLSLRPFVEAGAAWDRGGNPDDYRVGVGTEVVADLNLGWRFNIRLHLGLAAGVSDDGETQGYLLLSTF